MAAKESPASYRRPTPENSAAGVGMAHLTIVPRNFESTDAETDSDGTTDSEPR